MYNYFTWLLLLFDLRSSKNISFWNISEICRYRNIYYTLFGLGSMGQYYADCSAVVNHFLYNSGCGEICLFRVKGRKLCLIFFPLMLFKQFTWHSYIAFLYPIIIVKAIVPCDVVNKVMMDLFALLTFTILYMGVKFVFICWWNYPWMILGN